MSRALLQPTIREFRSDGFDPVAALRALGLEGRAPVVLLDSAGGSPELTRHHYLAWQPPLRLTVKDGEVRAGDRLYLQVGGGIVADSDPQREYEETLHKARGHAARHDRQHRRASRLTLVD